jgi:polyamine oxidase
VQAPSELGETDFIRLGVLQNDAVNFQPEVPQWKQDGINTFDMATYTKIFLQFSADKAFWDKHTQYFLYADPKERGWYPVFQSLDCPGFRDRVLFSWP